MKREGYLKNKAVIEAWANGAEIEYKRITLKPEYQVWESTKHPSFDFDEFAYRVKPTETAIPIFTNDDSIQLPSGSLDELIEALNIFYKYDNPKYPTYIENGMLCIRFDFDKHYDNLQDGDIHRLMVLGFNRDYDRFVSYRYGGEQMRSKKEGLSVTDQIKKLVDEYESGIKQAEEDKKEHSFDDNRIFWNNGIVETLENIIVDLKKLLPEDNKVKLN